MAGTSRWLAWSVTAAAVMTSCGGSSDGTDGRDAPTSPVAADAAPAAVEAWDDENGPGVVTLHPVITCAPGADATDGDARLARRDADESCVVGPPAGTGDVFERGSAVATFDETTAEWVVDVDLRAAGAVVWNAVARQCFDGDDVCPSRQLAIVLDDIIQSAPLVDAPDVAGTVRVAGAFTEGEARQLVSALNRPTEPESDATADGPSDGSNPTAAEIDESSAAATTAPTETAAPTTAAGADDEPPVGFLLPAMCGLPAVEWSAGEHPSSRDQGPWATGSRIDGDITGDGVDEIVWATVCGSGTVAAERSVHVFDDAHRPMGTLPMKQAVAEVYPDRTAHPIEPRIVDGQIELDVWVWQPADATCCPSVAFDMSFGWVGERLVPTTRIPEPGVAQPTAGEAPVVAWDGQYRPKTTPGRVVQLGHTGSQVMQLQRELDERGYDVDVDGYFGRGTEAAVRQFQRDSGLPVTGIAADDVWDQFDG